MENKKISFPSSNRKILLQTSECGEAILVKFRAECKWGQNEVGYDEDEADSEEERSPSVHQEEGEDEEPGWKIFSSFNITMMSQDQPMM